MHDRSRLVRSDLCSSSVTASSTILVKRSCEIGSCRHGQRPTRFSSISAHCIPASQWYEPGVYGRLQSIVTHVSLTDVLSSAYVVFHVDSETGHLAVLSLAVIPASENSMLPGSITKTSQGLYSQLKICQCLFERSLVIRLRNRSAP